MRIPTDIDDCLVQLDALFDDETKETIKSEVEDYFVTDAHFGVGMWIRNNWMLWSKSSRLVAYFNEFGVEEADDMSALICQCYHRYVNERDLDFEGLVREFKK